jgi:hypothetical protein
VIFIGQSNATRSAIGPTIEPVNNQHPVRAHWSWVRGGTAGTDMTWWVPGTGVGYAEFASRLSVIPSDRNVVIAFPQGESDCASNALATAFAARRQSMIDGVNAQRAGIKWVFFSLHSTLSVGAPADRATVNAGIASTAATQGANAIVVDMDANGASLLNEAGSFLHWGPDVSVSGTASAMQLAAMQDVDDQIGVWFP